MSYDYVRRNYYFKRGYRKIYRSDISLTLWRAVNKSGGRTINPLYPDLKERTLANGRLRLADVSTYLKMEFSLLNQKRVEVLLCQT